MTDPALGHLVEQHAVFARLSPAQKSRIILALRQRGHVVGFLGDGINDAPSLHLADVGISVATAVDVAQDAADVILQERSLRALHAGIIEGRRAFGNVIKYLLMGTSSGFGNNAVLAEAPCQQHLPEYVVELVRAGVEKVFALEVNGLCGREPFGLRQRRWSPTIA